MPIYRCNVCEFQCDRVGKYVSHYKFHRNVPGIIYVCPDNTCKQGFQNFASLKTHIYRAHQCSKTDAFPSSLNAAILTEASQESNGCIDLKCIRVECS